MVKKVRLVWMFWLFRVFALSKTAHIQFQVRQVVYPMLAIKLFRVTI